jgi:hypothetical protein
LDTISIAFSGDCSTKLSVVDDWRLREFANKFGMELVPLTGNDRDLHVEINFSITKSPSNLRRTSREKSILFCLEPRAVLPVQYTKRLRDKFGKVLVTSPLQTISDSDEAFDFGLLPDTLRSTPRDFCQRTDAVAILNANKTSWVSGSTYGLRRDWIREILFTGYPVHVGGLGWDRSFSSEIWRHLVSLVDCVLQGEFPDFSVYRPPLSNTIDENLSFHGHVRDGVDFLRKHKFCLVIENDVNYVSEKLFQAISAGCVPLYYGPNLSDFGIPPGLAINISREEGGDLTRCFQDTKLQEGILEAGLEFLSNQKIQSYWSQSSGLERLFQILRQYLDDNGSHESEELG